VTRVVEVDVPLLRKAVVWAEGEARLPEIDREWMQARYLAKPPEVAAVLLLDAVRDGPVEFAELEQLIPHCGTTCCIAGYVAQLIDSRYAVVDTVNDVFIPEFAQRALGITEEESEMLFDGSNSIADVRRIAEMIAGEPL
jgi:hypothetical protein